MILTELGFHKTAVFIPVPEYWAAKKTGFQLGRMVDALNRTIEKHDKHAKSIHNLFKSPVFGKHMPVSHRLRAIKRLADKARRLTAYKNTLTQAQELQFPKGIQN